MDLRELRGDGHSAYNDAKAAADPRHLLCKKMTFDPASPLTSYKEIGRCGARGNDARVDKTVCPGEAASVISMMATDEEAIRETIDGCEYFEYQIYACDEPSPRASVVITDADAPDNAGRANDLTTSTDCVDQGHLGAVLTKDECANAYYYLRQNPQEDATIRNWRWPWERLNSGNKKWPYGCWWQASNRDVWFWETPPDGTRTWKRGPARSAGRRARGARIRRRTPRCRRRCLPDRLRALRAGRFWWCYNNGVQNGNRDEAIAMCAEAGMQVIELRTQAKAMAFHRWADHEFWLGLTCRSEEAACDGQTSLWSWNSDNAPLNCGSGYIGFKKAVGGYTGFYGGAPTEFCARVGIPCGMGTPDLQRQLSHRV